MPSKNLFDEPFDEGTLTKLEIFEKYFEEWLPTFINSKYNKPIQVFDFFAGIGYDKSGQEGSPIRILKVIDKFRGKLVKNNKKVKIYLNDSDPKKYEDLVSNINNKVIACSLNSFVDLKITNKTFQDCLKIYQNELSNGCNLIFIDQNGFKEINEKTFQYLIQLKTTEFMFFISSTHIHRFAKLPEVQRIHPKFDFQKIMNTHRKKIHNVICDEYHKYLPKNIKSYAIIPFSIIKNDNNNVYGLIFVCKHIRGADKFLNIVWQKNPINGNANFDIDDDLTKNQLHLFNGKIPTKIEKFQSELKEKILNGEIKNNREAYIYTINQGHIHKHAYEIIRQMKKEKLIHYDSPSPLINYEQIFKNKRILNFKVK